MARPLVAILQAVPLRPAHQAMIVGIREAFTTWEGCEVTLLSLANLRTARPDGAILLGKMGFTEAIHEEDLGHLRATIPLLTLAQHESQHAPSVSFHLAAMMHRAVTELVQRCERRQIVLLSDSGSPFGLSLQQAFREAMLRHDLLIAPEWLIPGADQPNQADQALAAFLDAGGALDALVTTSTAAALAALKALKAHRLRVPRDVCVIGFENSPAAQQAGLTTFASDWQALGRCAARQLYAQLKHGPLHGQTLLDAPLIHRPSCQKS